MEERYREGMARTYTQEEVQAILGRALKQQRAGEGDGLSHEDLLAVGRELGDDAR
jgi:hypothetical protein